MVLLETRLIADHLFGSSLVLRQQFVQHQQLLKVTDTNHLEGLNPRDVKFNTRCRKKGSKKEITTNRGDG